MDREKHILVVDADAGVRDVVVGMLEERGYRATGVAGRVALRHFLDGVGGFDAIVMDAGDGGRAVQDLALDLKARRLPLVMISGNHAAMRLAAAHQLQLLWKPFLADELEAALLRAIGSGEFGQRPAC